jgi:hypothetical protein
MCLVEEIWGVAALVPLLGLFILLALAIRRQRRRVGDGPWLFGDGPPGDEVREPRRPLVPQGSASAAEPLPETPEVADAVEVAAPRSQGPDSLAV